MIVETRKQLHNILFYECKRYNLKHFSFRNIIPAFHPIANNYKYMRNLRKAEYLFTKSRKNNKLKPLYKILFTLQKMHLDRVGQKLNLDIGLNAVGRGLVIYHNASGIVVNPYAKVGEDCYFHGCNCVGNDGINLSKSPKIGNRVHLGFGASVIGDVTLADDIWVAAGSVVVSSFTEKGIIVGGVPARKIKNREDLTKHL